MKITNAQADGSGGMMLQPAQRKALREALLSAFPNPFSLNELTLLELGYPLEHVAMGPNLPTIVSMLITWAEAQNKLEGLIQGALSQNPGNGKLRAFSAIYLEKVFPLHERETLIEVAGGGDFTKEELLDCFRRSWPARVGGILPEVHEKDLLRQIVTVLGDVPEQSDGSLPLLQFAALLKVQTRLAATAERLKKWVTDTAALHGKPPADILPRLQQEAAAPSKALYLLMRIETATEGRCGVQAWVSQGADGPMLSIHADDKPRELGSVGELLSDLREKLTGNLMAAGNQLLIEVMLPLELLSHTVERWSLAQGEHVVVCGCKFPVVVRSWERVYDPKRITVRPDWKQKWDKLATLSPTSHPHSVVWEPEPGAVAKLFDRLSQEGAVCMALMHPHEGQVAESREALSSCIDAGTPVAIWGRKWCSDISKRREQLAQLLVDFRRLPERVRELRGAAPAGEEDHLGHSLVLLWDDPNRLPPDAFQISQLKLPSP